jgi:cytochrome c-type biogenesis protein
MFIAYLEGLVAALTPCTLVLIPAFLYYFGINNSEVSVNYKKMGISILGFLLFFVSIGLGLSQLVSSTYASGFRLAIGALFIYVGILQYKQKISPLQIKGVNNPFLFGALFGMITSVSPCVLPASVLLIAGNSTVVSLMSFITFGLGILTPSLVIALTGNKLTEKVKKIHKYTRQINIISALILILSGLVMLYNLLSLTKYDVLISGGILLILNLLILRLIFFVHKKRSIGTYLMIFSLFVILASSVFHCYTIAPKFHTEACDINEICEECQTCSKIFGVGVAVSAVGYISSTSEKQTKKKRFKVV